MDASLENKVSERVTWLMEQYRGTPLLSADAPEQEKLNFSWNAECFFDNAYAIGVFYALQCIHTTGAKDSDALRDTAERVVRDYIDTWISRHPEEKGVRALNDLAFAPVDSEE